MNVQQSLDEIMSDLTLEECNIGLQLIDKYLKKQSEKLLMVELLLISCYSLVLFMLLML